LNNILFLWNELQVNRIKACTFLPYLNKCDWSTDVISSIEEFISTDRQMICLFYENNILKATFCITDARTDSIMWFLKTPDSEHTNLNNSNFLKLISFGKMDTQVEKTMFLLLDSLYSPFIFSWSASILCFWTKTIYQTTCIVFIHFCSNIDYWKLKILKKIRIFL